MHTPYLVKGNVAIVGDFPIKRLLKSATNYQKYPSNIVGNTSDLGVGDLIKEINQAIQSSKAPDGPVDHRSFGN